MSQSRKSRRNPFHHMMNKEQNISIIIILLLCIGLAALFLRNGLQGGNSGEAGQMETQADTQKKKEKSLEGDSLQETAKPIVQEDGNRLKSRIRVPEGYQRVAAKKNSFASFLRNYKLKKAGSPVLYYDGNEKGNQNVHVGVFKLPMEEEDLQQCADSIMRMYAEYYWQTGQPDKIGFHFVNGFFAEYSKWRQGYRIEVSDSGCRWVHSAVADNSYETFQQYMRIVFSYASTLSMEKESKKISLSQIQAGDIFIKGGSPGHVVMVVDVCENAEGKKAFLLAQGFMPAQEFHLLKNPAHEEDPWYYEEEITYPLDTAEYTFEKGSLMRPEY